MPRLGPYSQTAVLSKLDGRTKESRLLRGTREALTAHTKQMIAAASLAPGASPTEVARQHGIGTGQLYNWRRALLAAQQLRPKNRDWWNTNDSLDEAAGTIC